MKLDIDDLRERLPPLYSQEAEADPHVYACFRLPGTDRRWYVMEGEPDGGDYLFSGFAVGAGRDEFRRFRLSELVAIRNLFDQPVERDLNFQEGRLTDVIPAPE
ncbi:MAG: DUF2958 domain-containing protein [Bryobacteraceae bacterium]|nr:DUF2958 domain-containing protein [Bryobacteraceae bacterium]